jgi:hypothetical protein
MVRAMALEMQLVFYVFNWTGRTINFLDTFWITVLKEHHFGLNLFVKLQYEFKLIALRTQLNKKR